MGTLTLDSAKIQFMLTVRNVEPRSLSEFIVWVDERIAQYKVTGSVGAFDKDESFLQCPWWIGDIVIESLKTICESADGKQAVSNYQQILPKKPVVKRQVERQTENLLIDESSETELSDNLSSDQEDEQPVDYIELRTGLLMYKGLGYSEQGMIMPSASLPQVFSCSICKVAYDTQADCEIHLETSHKPEENAVIESHESKELWLLSQEPGVPHRTEYLARTGLVNCLCPLCQFDAGSKQLLYSHMQSQHEGNLGWRVEQSDDSLMYVCLFCNVQRDTQQLVNIHLDTDHWLIKHQCHRCREMFERESELSAHVDHVHKRTRKLAAEEKFVEPLSLLGLNTNKEDMQCFQDLTGGVFMYKAVTSTETNCACEAKDEMLFMNREPHPDFVNQPGLPSLSCMLCDESFDGKLPLRQHMANLHNGNFGYRRSTTEPNNFVCLYCESVITGHSNIKYHLDKEHWFIKYQCPVCKTLLSRANRVKIHMAEVHGMKTTKKTKFQNRTREQTAEAYRADLYEEIRENLFLYRELQVIGSDVPKDLIGKPGISSLSCTLCGHHAHSKLSLYKHMMNEHHKNLGWKKSEGMGYECNFCTRQFNLLNSMKRHLEADHWFYKFRCPHCYKMMSQDHHVKSHIALVHGIKVTKDTRGRNRKEEPSDVITSRPIQPSVMVAPVVKAEALFGFQEQAGSAETVSKHSTSILFSKSARRLDDLELFENITGNVFMYKAVVCTDQHCSCEAKDEELFQRRAPHPDFVNKPGLSALVCPICRSMSFDGKRQFRDHMNDKHDGNFGYQKLGEKENIRFQCLFCSKLFETAMNVKFHLDKDHWFIKYQCEICFRLLGREHRVKTHMAEVHGQKVTREASTSGNDKEETLELLAQHYHTIAENIHIYKHLKPLVDAPADLVGKPGIDRLDCSICSSNLITSKLELYDHMTKQHKNIGWHRVGEDLLVCNFCPRSFRLTGSIRRHVESDHWFFRYQCPHCGKLLSQGHHVKSHIAMVHGVKVTARPKTDVDEVKVHDGSFSNLLRGLPIGKRKKVAVETILSGVLDERDPAGSNESRKHLLEGTLPIVKRRRVPNKKYM